MKGLDAQLKQWDAEIEALRIERYDQKADLTGRPARLEAVAAKAVQSRPDDAK